MTDHDGRGVCATDDVLVELALGQLDGRERTAALEHLATCPDCTRRMREFVVTTELVLSSAPSAEPPVGFESEVVQKMRQPRRRLWRRALLTAAAVVLTAIGTVGLLVTVVGQDAAEVDEARMVTPTGRDVGAAWILDDEVSWIFVSLPNWEVDAEPDGSIPDYRLEATLEDGSTVDMGAVIFDDSGAWASAVDPEAGRISHVAVVDDAGQPWCEGRF